MLNIFIFAIGIMYTPGPVNMLALFSGIKGERWNTLFFCLGVGCAMTLMFMILGYLGDEFLSNSLRTAVAVIGGLYIGYLSIKLMCASFKNNETHNTNTKELNFWVGLFMQLSNPKSLVVILPIVSVQFPKVHIEGTQIGLMSLALGILAFGAPTVYLIAGYQLKQALLNPKLMNSVNRVMAVVLGYIAIRIGFSSFF